MVTEMTPRPPLRSAIVVALVLGLASCAISQPIEQQHPSVQRATPSADDSLEARRATALETAAREMNCPRVEIVLTLERRYANTATARYLIEGCGQRALYAETCADYPRCRYLMLSMMPVPGAPAAPDARPPSN